MRPQTFHANGEYLGWLQCRHWLFLARQNSKQPIRGITRINMEVRHVKFQTARRHERENVCLFKLKEEKQDSEIFCTILLLEKSSLIPCTLSPNMEGITKLRRDISSSKLFCSGVPVRSSRRRA